MSERNPNRYRRDGQLWVCPPRRQYAELKSLDRFVQISTALSDRKERSWIAEGVYRVEIARPELNAFLGGIAVQGAHTWASFTSAVYHEGLLVGQLAVLENETNPVLAAVLDNGLEATALSSDLLSKAPAVLTLDIAGTGNFKELATALRKALDEIRRVRLRRTGVTQTARKTAELKTNNILAGPLDAILSMQGRVVDGIYTAAIGRRALLYGEPIAREMGMRTSISISGTTDHALLQGQAIATTDELQNVLKALRAQGIQVASIRNHYVGEYPQYMFVHFWSEGPAIDVARSFRYVLDVQVGAAHPNGRRNYATIKVLPCAIVILLFIAGHVEARHALRKVTTIDLPGPRGQRFGYLTMDDEDHVLLSAHLGPGILYVIDVSINKLVKAIPGVPGITGLEYVPRLRKVYTSNWGKEKIGVVDLHTMSVIKRLPTEAKPNGSTYAEPFEKVYVSDTLGKVAAVDINKDQIVKTLRFNSETGMPQYDSVARKVYVNLRSKNEIAEIDPSNDSINGKYPVEGCRFNHGMAIDSEHHGLFYSVEAKTGGAWPCARQGRLPLSSGR